MTKARDLADLISAGNPLADGSIEAADISDVTATAAELNKLDGLTASTAELNNVVGSTSALQSQLDNISVTSGSLTKSFTNGETASITLSSALSTAPVVGVTKEVAQTGISSKGAWDVNATASNYELHNTAYSTTLTPSTVGYAFSSAVDDSNQLSYGGTDNYMQKLYISPDGLNVILSGNSPQTLYYWQLSTAWDLSTASYYSSFDPTGTIGANDISMLSFKSDGTKMYVGSYGNDYIYAFNLSTAWYINTATSASESFYIGGDVTVGQGFAFSSDGTEFYVGDLGAGDITQYSMSTAWDISSATSSPTAIYSPSFPSGKSLRFVLFNSDGTKMYINNANAAYLTVAEYSLSTAWAIHTASPTGNNFDYSSDVGDNVPAFWLKPDGTKIFFMNNTTSPSKLMRFSISSDALVLGTGSFASTDVGKRIQGNGGDVILTSTAGAYDTTGGSDFTDTSTIASGSWTMHGLKSAGDTDGLTITGVSNAYDLSQASYVASRTISNSINGTDITFSTDGTVYYVCGGGFITQYNLSTAFDLTTGTSNGNFAPSGWGSFQGVAFSNDGTKMYICGERVSGAMRSIYQYSLSTAWDVTTATEDAGQVYNFGAGYPTGLYITPTGNKIYASLQSLTDGRVWEITLGTNFNVGSATSGTYENLAADFGIGADLMGIDFKPDGTKFYVVCRSNDYIYEFSLSTAFELTGANLTYNGFVDASAIATRLEGVALNSSGTKLYVPENSTDVILEYNIGELFQPTSQYHIAATNSGGQIDTGFWTDINSMTADQSLGDGEAYYAVSTDDRTTWSVAKASDGVRPIVRNNAGTWQYNTAVGTGGYGFSNTASYDNVVYNFSGLTSQVLGLSFKPDGTKLYMLSDASDQLIEVTLSTAFDITTASYTAFKSLSGETNQPRGIQFKPDGTRFFITDNLNDRIAQYNLTTAWDITTASQVSSLFTSGKSETSPTGIDFNNDGTKIYWTGTSTDTVYQYSLSTAYDVSTATDDNKSFSLSTQMTAPSAIRMSSDGYKMFVATYAAASPLSGGYVFEYDLETAYDISTASYSGNSLNVNNEATDGWAIDFKPDGTKMYVSDYSGTHVYQYTTLGEGYSTATTWTNATTNDEFSALQEALGATSANRMDKTQLDAVADGSHFTLGDTLDLAIALKQDTASASLPTSDGVTINYDAQALNQGAVLGTDYDYDFPDSTTVRITSNAAQNLKIRVV
jgi:DNA-binding beta-propeller fold protein YncE